MLSDTDARAVDARVGRLEARVGVQVVAAVVGKSDAYPELPWKAFALGAALAGLAVVSADAFRPQWVTSRTALVWIVFTLAVAAGWALASVFVPGFARVFLRAHRAETEVRQYAQSLFLTRGLFSTQGRTGVLLLVSLFERRVELLPDTGFRERMSARDWQAVVDAMMPALRHERAADALLAGLDALGPVLAERGFVPGVGRNELPDAPVVEAGS
jgi:putative membrane protein